MAKQQKRPSYTTPIGEGRFIFVNTPKTKAGDNVLKTPQYCLELILDGTDPKTQEMLQLINTATEDAFQYFSAKVKADPKLAKKLKLVKHVPYGDELDDDGEETGNIVFKFSSNAERKDKEGNMVPCAPPMQFDRFGNKLDPKDKPVYSGSKLQVSYTLGPQPKDQDVPGYLMMSTGMVGAKLYLNALRIAEYSEGRGGSAKDYGFDSDENGEAQTVGALGAADDDVPF